MRRITFLIALAGCALLRADTITWTTSVFSSGQPCGNFQDCQPFHFFVPSFEPGAELQSIHWTFTDDQQYYGGFNDMYETPGQPFTWTTTEGAFCPVLGLSVSNTQDISYVTTGTTQISMGGVTSEHLLQASGSAPDLNGGAGGLDIEVTPFLFATTPVVAGSDNGGVQAALIYVSDAAALSVTETFAPVPVPEAGMQPLLSLAMLALAQRRAGGQLK